MKERCNVTGLSCLKDEIGQIVVNERKMEEIFAKVVECRE